ncbi:hypothetical protein F5883DRAFT_423478 [Diaporthe sp. PMI_573]|nr:hypothetical protein F5883DRAFT_423478 [Diaporthaceae sp. PMI_573]
MATTKTTGKISFLQHNPLYSREKPYLVLLPPSQDAEIDRSIPRSNLLYQYHLVDIRDVRGHIDQYQITECGFQYIQHKTAVNSLLGLQGDGPTRDDVDTYKVETEAVLKDFFQAEQRTDLKSTWRSLNPTCEDSPLAFCDYRSVEAQDLIPSDRIIPERAGEVYYLFHNERQRWCWLSEQTPNDLAVFVLYDDKPGDQAKYCPHIAFVNLDCRPDAPPRRSVETRSIIISPLED